MKREGSSLVEAMIALGLVMMGLLGIVALLTRSLALNRAVVNETIAAGLAAEGIEVMRNIIDANIAERGRALWTENLSEGEFSIDAESVVENTTALRPFDGVPLWFRPSDGTYGVDERGGEASRFTRKLAITMFADDEVQVNSIVEWDEKGETKSLNVEDHFFNWRP